MLEEQPECRDDAFARTAYNICRWHHERYDGGGYPDGLQGEQIPIEAQVVGLADVYERLVSRPVDGHARTHSEVVQMICTGVCGAFESAAAGLPAGHGSRDRACHAGHAGRNLKTSHQPGSARETSALPGFLCA